MKKLLTRIVYLIIAAIVSIYIIFALWRSYQQSKHNFSRHSDSIYRFHHELASSLSSSNLRTYDSNDVKYPIISNTFPDSIENHSLANQILFTPKFNNDYISKLPNFSRDGSDYIFSSLIERSFDELGPYITTFFLSHQMLKPSLDNSYGYKKVSPEMKLAWRKMTLKISNMGYDLNGSRGKKYQYFCRIKNSPGDKPYIVRGIFMPNRLTADSNSNRRLDVLRCPMIDGINATNVLHKTSFHVSVEIIINKIILIKFEIPWNLRRTGYLLDSTRDTSMYNAWEKHLPKNDPIIHLCMPGSLFYPSLKSLPWVLEFVTHHLLLGFGHIHMGVSFGYNSSLMTNTLTVVHRYIAANKLSLISQAGDGVDFILSSGGLEWDNDIVGVFQSNMILYLSKGVADYLAVFHIDELLIPHKLQYNSVVDLMVDIDVEKKHSFSLVGKALADHKKHPACYFKLTSEVLTKSNTYAGQGTPGQWLSEAFPNGPEPLNENSRLKSLAYPKAIYPTRVIFQTGISSGGGCRLPIRNTPCEKYSSENPFCFKVDYLRDPDQKSIIREHHLFDEAITDDDAFSIDNSLATVYHYLQYRPETGKINSIENKYSTKYFPRVVEELKSIGVFDIMKYSNSIPYTNSRPYFKINWESLLSLREMRTFRMQLAIEGRVHGLDHTEFIHLNVSNAKSPKFVEESTLSESVLPSFSYGYEDFVLSSMIERESESYQLFLSTFFLSRRMLIPKEGDSAASVESVHPDVVDLWLEAVKSFNYSDYTENGERLQTESHFTCRIKHSKHSLPYSVSGRFVPNKLTPDSNSNSRLDILRCPMEGSREVYEHLDDLMKEDVTVEIFKGTKPIINFRIPWASRMIGYMLTKPKSELIDNYVVSNWNPWENVDFKTNPKTWHHDKLYMCVPGLESAPDKITLPLYLEFVEHHLQLGVDRIFIVAAVGWKSPDMIKYLRLFSQYINEGKVSLHSSAFDGYDYVYSFQGLQLDRDNVKNFYVNMCTYFSKGVADYIAVWDFDEFFIPMGKYENILDLIDANDVPPNVKILKNLTKLTNAIDWVGGRGLADFDGHPLCYMILNSLTTLQQKAFSVDWDYTHSWIGERFTHSAEVTLRDGRGLSFKKSIRPTRTVFQGGLHMVGACRLPREWDGCDYSSKHSNNNLSACYNMNGNFKPSDDVHFMTNHSFDSVVMDRDAKTINTSDAFINHIQFYRFWFGATPSALSKPSEYSTRFFPRVYSALKERGLDLIILLPETSLPTNLQVAPSSDYIEFKMPTMSSNGENNVKKNRAFTERAVFLYSNIEMSSNKASLFASVNFLSTNSLLADNIINEIIAVKSSAQNEWITRLSSTISDDHTIVCSVRGVGYDNVVLSEYTSQGRWKSLGAHGLLFDTLRCDINEELKNLVESLSNRDTESYLEIHLLTGNMTQHSKSLKTSFITRPDIKTFRNLLYTATAEQTLGYMEINPSKDVAFICVPGYDVTPSRQSVGMLLEFVTHHILQGIDHIILNVAFASGSTHMELLNRILKPFIDERKLSIRSQIVVEDFAYGVDGLLWSKRLADDLSKQHCSQSARGMADYLIYLDINEFIIAKPRGRNSLSSADEVYVDIKPSISYLAQSHSDAFGDVKVPVAVVSNKNENIIDASSLLWTGNRFKSSPVETNESKSIVVLRQRTTTKNSKDLMSEVIVYKFEAIETTVNLELQSQSSPVFGEESISIKYVPTYSNESNMYCDYYFPKIYENLKLRQLDLLVDIPQTATSVVTAEKTWIPYQTIWKKAFHTLPWEVPNQR